MGSRALFTAARLTAALLVAAAAALPAQLVGAAGLGASLQRDGGGLWQSLTRLEPAVRLDNPWFQLGGTASFVSGDRRIQLDAGSIDGAAETPAWHGARVSTTGQLQRRDLPSGFARTTAEAEAALSYGLHGSGAWIGLAAERAGPSLGSSQNDAGTGLLRLGVWQQLGPVSVVVGSARHESRDATLAPGRVPLDTGRLDSTSVSRTALRRWSDTEARVLWSFGRVALDGRFGVQSVDSARGALWGRATATIAMSPRLSLVSAFGTEPARAWMGVPGSRFATLGVRIAPAALSRPPAPAHVQPAAHRFTMRPVAAEQGTYVVSIAVPAARSVEISGDFNAWRPVPLREVSPDVWEATIAIAPGTYHVNLRVNGAAWIAPPGLSQTTDDFNGSVGLLVVP